VEYAERDLHHHCLQVRLPQHGHQITTGVGHADPMKKQIVSIPDCVHKMRSWAGMWFRMTLVLTSFVLFTGEI
jgi:hypothetical protein